ncbi:MAG: hydrogen peroxide-inducible genes activator [Gammaproteobacteria bacterium]|nr:hydrogen peroxide-inducible genes activator [Gammaproteobacteria bacterium]
MASLPTVRQLTYLCALADKRHFRKAAESCYVSQSALSTAITELESNLGVSLFERGTSILLTPIGEKLVGEARKVLNDLQHFVEHAEQSRGQFQSDLRLGIIPTIAPFLLPKILKAMHQQYGDNKLYIREDLSPNLLEMLGKGELDVLLFALPYDTGNYHCHPLFEDELVLCLPRQHTLGNKDAVSIKDLKQQDILLLEDGHCLRDQSLRACNLQTRDLSIPYQATSLNTLVQMVVNNIGITLLPEMAVKANILHDTDAEIRPLQTARNVSRSIALVWRKHSPRATEFEQLGEIILQHK